MCNIFEDLLVSTQTFFLSGGTSESNCFECMHALSRVCMYMHNEKKNIQFLCYFFIFFKFLSECLAHHFFNFGLQENIQVKNTLKLTFSSENLVTNAFVETTQINKTKLFVVILHN